MTSKERVLRSIRHERVDRIPCFYLGVPEVNTALAQRLGIPAGGQEVLLERLGADVRYAEPQLKPVVGETRYAFSYGAVHARMHSQPGAEEPSAYPVGDAVTPDDLDAWRWPDPDWFDYSIPADLLDSWQDKAVVAYNMGILFLYAMGVRGMEQIMLDMAGEPKMAHAIFGRIAAFNLEYSRRFLEANAGKIDILGLGDDVAAQRGMVVSPGMWRTYMRPHVEAMVALCREFGVIPYYHGCGGFRDLYSDFIEMGIPCTGRLQTEAAGNDLRDLKMRFGADLCLWGAIDGQHAVIEGTPEAVRTHVCGVLEIGGAGSGFVAGPTHSFTADTPIENIVAVYEVIADQGGNND